MDTQFAASGLLGLMTEARLPSAPMSGAGGDPDDADSIMSGGPARITAN